MSIIITHSITFYRPGARSLAEGEVTYLPPTSLGAIRGSLQPYEQGSRYGEIAKVLPSGVDSFSIKMFYTATSTLRGSNTFNNQMNDYCVLNDGVYEILQVSDWQMLDFNETSHTMYFLVRRPDSTGDLPR